MTLEDPRSWEVVMVRCPRCRTAVVAGAATLHLERHCVRLIPGDYLTQARVVTKTKRDAAYIYIGRGRATHVPTKTVHDIGEWGLKP